MKEQAKGRFTRESLIRIIDTCRMIEERGLDPFSVDVRRFIETLKELYPNLVDQKDVILDSEALDRIASLIKLQSECLERRSTSLYTDPFLIQEKIRLLSKEELAQLFLRAWRPIIELEQVTTKSLALSAEYWRDLLPLDVRWSRVGYKKTTLLSSTYDELIKQKIVSEKTFTEELENLWEELKNRVEDSGKISYKEFVYVGSYPETIVRAFLTSFLITYGYAKLEVHLVEEEMYLIPLMKPAPPSRGELVISFPIPLDYEDWAEWRKRA
ncbi:MAG: hypothetical protein QXL67_00955 [Candidatus Bathyarchaeia archaeon]